MSAFWRDPNESSAPRCSRDGSHHVTSNAAAGSPSGYRPGRIGVAYAADFLVWPFEHGVAPEVRTPDGGLGRGPGAVRIDRAVQHVDPLLALLRVGIGLVADAGDHEQVARPRRRDVREPMAFGPVARHLRLTQVDEFGRCTSRNRLHAQAARRDERARGPIRREPARDVGQDHDGELEALGLVDGHQAHAVRPLLEDRALGRLGERLVEELLHEASERGALGRLVLASELHDVQHVGQRLLAPGTKREPGVRARGAQQGLHRVLHGHAVALAVQRLQEPQRVLDVLHVRRLIVAGGPLDADDRWPPD